MDIYEQRAKELETAQKARMADTAHSENIWDDLEISVDEQIMRYRRISRSYNTKVA